MSTFIPVNPTRTKSGALTSLVPILGEENAKPIPLKSKKGQFKGILDITSEAISIRTAAKLNLGNIFSGAVQSNEIGYYFDAMLQESASDVVPAGTNKISATKWGVGIRILLRIQNFDASANLSIAALGASVELKQATAQYHILAFGLDQKTYGYILNEVALLGDFSYDTYYKINNNIIKKVGSFVADESTVLEPDPIAVALNDPIDPFEESRSYYYAMYSISEKRPLTKALSKAGLTYNRSIIKEVYHEIAGVSKGNEPITRESEKKAEEWLKL